MRLTLRTLLAYLDDTLEPSQAKEIGRKVAESPVAQELIERIKAVTRRRGLTIPPASGPDRIDANTVAEYLDNDLPDDRIAEVEETALTSDVHLAEIAACHQILTLVVGEPAHVPPVARQRMYGLVRGLESDVGRRVSRIQPLREPGESESSDDRRAAQRGVAIRLLGAGLLTLALSLAIWQLLTTLPQRGPRLPGEPPPLASAEADAAGDPAAVEPKLDAPKPAPPPVVPPADAPKPEPPQPEPVKPEPPRQPIDQVPDRKPNAARKETGAVTSKAALVLAQGDGWTRLPADARVSTNVPLMALPGYHGELRLDSGVLVQLWGGLPDQTAGWLECLATLHVPPPGFAADVTLQRGRIYLLNPDTAPARVRLRIADEIWDLTIPEKGGDILAVVSADFAGEPFRRDGKGESPTKQVLVAALAGTATVQIDARQYELRAPPAGRALTWDNKKAGVQETPLAAIPPAWQRRPPRAAGNAVQFEIDQALRNLFVRATAPNKPIEIAIAELAEGDRFSRSIAVLAAGAIGSLPPVLDALEDDGNAETRRAAALALQSYIVQAPANDLRVFEQLQEKLGYTDRQADETMRLLHGYSEAAANDPNTFRDLLFMLQSERLGERELALWRLGQLDPDGAARIRFRPTDPPDQRERALAEWRRRIPDGKLPPGR